MPRGIDSLCFRLSASGRSVSGWRVAVRFWMSPSRKFPSRSRRIRKARSGGEDFIPVRVRKLRRNNGNASEEVVIARCPVFTGGHRGGVAPASSVGWLSTRILPSPEGGDGADALRQRRTVAALAISSRALIGFSIGGSLGVDLGLISGLSRWENGCWIPQSDVAQRAASGADPAGDFVVWH